MNYQYDLVKKLSFVRFGGTEAELSAAQLLLSEISSLGGSAELEEFSIPAWEIKTCSVVADGRALDVSPWGLSGGFPEGGVDLRLIYLEDCSASALYGIDDLSGYAVLVNDMNVDKYKLLYERRASAILVISGRWYSSPENSDFLERHLRPAFQKFGKIPSFYVWAKDAADLVRDEVETIHIELVQEELTHVSRNVVAVIPGRELTGESLVVTAHYDSVKIGTGSWDNATGAATAMYLYRHFLANPPKRTLRFVWCGSEEQGLLGSRAYVEAHPELVRDEIKFCVNFDMCGTVLGTNRITVTAGEDVKHFAEAFCREYGLNASVNRDVRSSDSACFADEGVPSVDLIRSTPTAEIHTRHDLIDTLSAKQLKRDGDFAVAFIERIIGAVQLPTERVMPKDMVEKIDKYFRRDLLPKEEK